MTDLPPPPGSGEAPPPPPDLVPPGAETSSRELVRPYRDPRPLAVALTFLFALVIVQSLATMALKADERSLAQEAKANPFAAAGGKFEEDDDQELAAGALGFLVTVATAVVFIVWVHRAYSNLPVLGSRPLRFGTGWAVGAWFVPVLNLIRPFQIVQDAWRGADPDAPPTDPEWQRRRMSGLVTVWWLLWVSGLIFGVASRGTEPDVVRLGDADSMDRLILFDETAMAAAGLAAVTAVVAIVVVRGLSGRQAQRARRLGLAG